MILHMETFEGLKSVTAERTNYTVEKLWGKLLYNWEKCGKNVMPGASRENGEGLANIHDEVQAVLLMEPPVFILFLLPSLK